MNTSEFFSAPRMGSLLLALLLTGCATTTQAPAPDGLVLQPTQGLDTVYLRPGVDFRSYGNLVLEPVEVAFDKDWDPNSTQRDLARRLKPEDIQKIRELTSGGYQVVERAGADSLVTSASLTDVYINAPDVMAPGRSRTYTMESGRMTLVMDLKDGATGQLIGRVVDRKIGDNFGRLEITDSVTNSADFRRAVTDWATRLRKGLDTLRSDALRRPGT
jgi:hypothetical protein